MALVHATDYLEDIILGMVLKNVAAVTIAAPYLGLFTSFTDVDDGDTFVEVTTVSTGYARQALTFDAPDADGVCITNAAATFAAALVAYGTVTHFGLFDAATTGNLLYWAALPVAQAVDVDAIFEMAAGLISVSHVGACSAYLSGKLLNRFLRNQAWAAIANVYALLMNEYTSDADWDEVPTAGPTGYARQAATFGTITAGVVSNNALIDFGTALLTWNEIKAFGLSNASSAGDLLYRGYLPTPRTIGVGRGFKMNIGDLTVSQD